MEGKWGEARLTPEMRELMIVNALRNIAKRTPQPPMQVEYTKETIWQEMRHLPEAIRNFVKAIRDHKNLVLFLTFCGFVMSLVGEIPQYKILMENIIVGASAVWVTVIVLVLFISRFTYDEEWTGPVYAFLTATMISFVIGGAVGYTIIERFSLY